MVIVKNSRRGKLRLANGVALKPGRNEVPEDVWERCAMSPITAHYLTRGEVVVVPGPCPSHIGPTCSGPGTSPYGEPETPPLPLPLPQEAAEVSIEKAVWLGPPPIPAKQPQPQSLDAMRAKDAIGVVQGLDSPHKLLELLRVEARTTVIRAIERRIQELEA